MSEKIKDFIEHFMENIEEPFCSEVDFQFHLAWYLKEQLTDFNIILEYPTVGEFGDEKTNKIKHRNVYIDICLINANTSEKYFIELKYKTRNEEINRHGVTIELKNQAAQDLGRYLFIKDIQRLENFEDITCGFCLMLTNDPPYYNSQQPGKKTMDSDFRIGNQCTINKKEHCWDNQIEDHWTKKYPPLIINNEYNCIWTKCKSLPDNFKYLLLKIDNCKIK